jgi:predicted DNA repair protein MutK
MSGLLALLDDVAALAKLAASQLDDVAAHAAKAGAKAAGVVIDDSAVTPKYVHGLPAARELPIVWQIARGSLFNKLVVLLPVALALNAFAPWLVTPLLMIGGAYLCFEGAEKILHVFAPHSEEHAQPETLDAARLERTRVAGAIKTDFILSAEIMAIALSTVAAENIWTAGIALAAVAVGITALVYGTVALLVKADDMGLKLTQIGRLQATRALGRAIVAGMPKVLDVISVVGTAAMLWVGGSIVLHGLAGLGLAGPEHIIHGISIRAAALMLAANGFVQWIVKATLDGIFGLVVGLAIIPVATRLVSPLMQRFGPRVAQH